MVWYAGDVGVVCVEDVSLLLCGGDGVVSCGNGLVSVRGVCVFIVEASYVPPEFGGICVV